MESTSENINTLDLRHRITAYERIFHAKLSGADGMDSKHVRQCGPGRSEETVAKYTTQLLSYIEAKPLRVELLMQPSRFGAIQRCTTDRVHDGTGRSGRLDDQKWVLKVNSFERQFASTIVL